MQGDWQPTCSLAMLRLRAQMLQHIRDFFAERQVLEVETPLLGQAIGTDPQLQFFSTQYGLPSHEQRLFLQTSPEFAMKRLLAAGSGCIYQICKAFRNGEAGRFHNPEFTLLEWYRLDFDLQQLMDEVEDLLQLLLQAMPLKASQRISYQAVFYQHTGLDALVFSLDAYQAFAIAQGLPEAVDICGENHAIWLDFLFSHCVQPTFAANTLTMVFAYPACQSSLARTNVDNPLVTERVELFINGVELGNGYHELTDAVEQNRRFDAELTQRQQWQLPVAEKDQRLLAALQSGLPNCSGIAIGIDRLLMLLSASPAIDEVLSFPVHRA